MPILLVLPISTCGNRVLAAIIAPRKIGARNTKALCKPFPSSPIMAKSKKKENIFLVCEECGDYNYSLKRKLGGEKLRLKKYCQRLRKHTFHIEKKK